MSELHIPSMAAVKTNAGGWQDTNVNFNMLMNALGPGRISPTLQFNLDIEGDTYHRDSMKGQTADVPNPQFLYKLPAVVELLGSTAQSDLAHHREILKGQSDPAQNFLLAFGIFSPPGIAGGLIGVPPFKRKELTQDAAQSRNPVLDLLPSAQPPFKPNQFEVEETYRHDSLSGQYARTGAVVVTGPPVSQSEIYTFVSRLKTAQEPYLFPNVVAFFLPPAPQPFIERQSEDLDWRGKKTQEPFQPANALLNLLAPVQPAFVQRQSEDRDWRGKKTQEAYDFPNRLVLIAPPLIVQPFVQSVTVDATRTGQYTQDLFILPNNLILQVQQLIYTPLGLAMQILATAGFTVNPVVLWQYSTTVPYYMVISQLPIGGSIIEYQAVPIQLTASAGPPPPSAEQVSVPNVVGMISLQALQSIGATPLNIGVVTFVELDPSLGVPINAVTAQSPAAGTVVQSYSGVNLTVNSGPPQDMLFNDLYTIPIVSPQV
jgi:hypothetical protein